MDDEKLYEILPIVAPYLDLSDVLSLSTLNIGAVRYVKQYISNQVWFKIDARSKLGFQLKHYVPVRLEIHGRYLLQYISDPSQITHLWTDSTDPDEINSEYPRFPKLISLDFGNYFNHTIYDPLPSSVKYLSFGKSFNKPVDGLLPPSLLSLSFCGAFNHELEKLPSTLQHFSISGEFSKPLYLPQQLQSLHLEPAVFLLSLDSLPPNLTYLFIGKNFNNTIDSLPDSLITLKFHKHSHFNKPIASLPSKLKTLIFGQKFNYSLDYILPATLTHLNLGAGYATPLLHSLPDSLLRIYIPFDYYENNRVPYPEKFHNRVIFVEYFYRQVGYDMQCDPVNEIPAITTQFGGRIIQ